MIINVTRTVAMEPLPLGQEIVAIVERLAVMFRGAET